MSGQASPVHTQPNTPILTTSQLEHLLQDIEGLIRILDSMTRSPRITVDFVVVSALKGLVAEEVDLGVLDSAQGLFGLDMAEAVSLIPASWEDIEGDLAAYRVAAVRTSLVWLVKWVLGGGLGRISRKTA